MSFPKKGNSTISQRCWSYIQPESHKEAKTPQPNSISPEVLIPNWGRKMPMTKADARDAQSHTHGPGILGGLFSKHLAGLSSGGLFPRPDLSPDGQDNDGVGKAFVAKRV